ncbi:MAG TPA: WYL domain-containing protein, partial [Actinomycetota bacterium]|nr:WYL domain-containing protein [Actinomycetota bacterium]
KSELDERRVGFRATARAEAESVPWLRSEFGTRLSVGEQLGDADRVEVELRSWSAHTLAGELAAFARWVEVVEPEEVRDELARIGAELSERYGPRPSADAAAQL